MFLLSICPPVWRLHKADILGPNNSEVPSHNTFSSPDSIIKNYLHKILTPGISYIRTSCVIELLNNCSVSVLEYLCEGTVAAPNPCHVMWLEHSTSESCSAITTQHETEF